jgi:thiamine pyrophosphate-dependent acetolactate synthase large subunit-like protein
MGAKLHRPDSETWVIYGDGAFGYSLIEFETFVRLKIPVIAVIGNDACWSQIAREQVKILQDDVGTRLQHSDYHLAAAALGGKGFLIEKPEQIEDVLRQAKQAAAEGHPVLIKGQSRCKNLIRQSPVKMDDYRETLTPTATGFHQ